MESSKVSNLQLYDYRLALSRAFGFLIFAVVFFSNHSWIEGGLLDGLMEGLGFILIVIAVLGRLWSSLFICGKKNKFLITEGPYSVVRNPLYVFSFIGTLGIGLATESLLIASLLVAFFILLYRQSVAQEEHKLSLLFEESYQNYQKTIPQFVPSFRNYRQPTELVVDVKRYSRAFFDAMWFLWLFGALQIVEKLHEINWIPVLFYLP